MVTALLVPAANTVAEGSLNRLLWVADQRNWRDRSGGIVAEQSEHL